MADVTATTLIKSSLRAIGAIATGISPTADELADGLEALQFLLRDLITKGRAIFAVEVENFALTAGTASYTIGSGGDFNTDRPARIEAAYVRSDSIDYRLEIVGQSKYASVAGKDSPSATPSLIWYNPAYGADARGTIYVWPPGSGTLYIHSLKPISEPASVGSDVELPPEYDPFIKWALACELAPEYGKEPTPYMMGRAAQGLQNLISFGVSMNINEVSVGVPGNSRGTYNINEG